MRLDVTGKKAFRDGPRASVQAAPKGDSGVRRLLRGVNNIWPREEHDVERAGFGRVNSEDKIKTLRMPTYYQDPSDSHGDVHLYTRMFAYKPVAQESGLRKARHPCSNKASA
jgi:hypothetical protein